MSSPTSEVRWTEPRVWTPEVRWLEDGPMSEWLIRQTTLDRMTNARWHLANPETDRWVPIVSVSEVFAYAPDEDHPLFAVTRSNYTSITRGPIPPLWRRLCSRPWWRGWIYGARVRLSDWIAPYPTGDDW